MLLLHKGLINGNQEKKNPQNNNNKNKKRKKEVASPHPTLSILAVVALDSNVNCISNFGYCSIIKSFGQAGWWCLSWNIIFISLRDLCPYSQQPISLALHRMNQTPPGVWIGFIVGTRSKQNSSILENNSGWDWSNSRNIAGSAGHHSANDESSELDSWKVPNAVHLDVEVGQAMSLNIERGVFIDLFLL